jgi:hypothetical protein
MNTQVQNKQFIFHSRANTRMYDVCFDVFYYLY